MKIQITMALYILRRTQSGICHQCRSATRLNSSFIIYRSCCTIITIKSMVCTHLMSHFMRYKIKIKLITNGIQRSCYTFCLSGAKTNRSSAGNPTSTGTKNMANIIIGSTNHIITSSLIFT